MRIKPCHGCLFREGCELRNEFRARARGVGASSVTFRCGRLLEKLKPGTRIVVTAPGKYTGYHYDGSESDCIQHVQVNATVTRCDDRGRFACVIDPGQVIDEHEEDAGDIADKYRFRRLAPISRIKRLLDEPALPICEAGNVVHEGKCDSSDPEGCHCPLSPRGQAMSTELEGWS